MKKRFSNILKKVGIALLSLGTLLSTSAMAEFRVHTDGGLKVYDPSCPAYWFALGARLEFDEVMFSGDAHSRQDNFPTSANIRRGYLGFRGGVGDCWIYNLTLDFGRYRSRVTFQEAWVGYTGLWDDSRLRIGQITPITTFDGYGNTGIHNGQMFLEPALATRAFSVPGYPHSGSEALKSLGIILDTQFADMFSLALTVYQPAQGSDNFNHPHRSDRLGEAARLIFSPVHEEGCVWHFAVMGRHQSVSHSHSDGTAVLNDLFQTTPEVVTRRTARALAHLDDLGVTTTFSPFLVDAGQRRVKEYNYAAAEAATIWGPFTLAGEYHAVGVHRKIVQPSTNASHLNFHGWHVEGGYVLTGEHRNYDFPMGTLLGIKPCHPCGAWEIAARYSYVTLVDKDVFGGSEHNVTVGLNWYVNEHVRFALNYIRANIHPTGTVAGTAPALIGTPKRKLDILGFRAQVVF